MSAQSSVFDNRQQNLIMAAAHWRLVSMLFECPCEGWHASLASLAAEASDPDLIAAAAAAQSEASEGLYHSIFGPGGPASPREASYRSNLNLGGLLSELTAYYDAFGFQPTTQEPCDHISVEAGFLGYLRLKEAYARACTDQNSAEITAEGAMHFLQDHLAVLAERLSSTRGQSGIRYISIASQVLKRMTGS
jgi:nitrate reductase assembly molybdenum cofactor insertion protein NarJ